MKVILNARVAPELKEKLEKMAKIKGLTTSSITELCIKEYFKNEFKINNFESILEFERSAAQIDALLEVSKEERQSAG
jgi:predicted transcriptional regulator